MKIRSLKFMTDENISPRVVSFLRQKGVDVIDVKEEGWFGSDDKYLMGIAYEGKRFILTHDSDFATLAIKEGVQCYGIIYLRMKDLKIDNVVSVLNRLFMVEEDINEGALIVVEDKRLRIRNIMQ